MPSDRPLSQSFGDGVDAAALFAFQMILNALTLLPIQNVPHSLGMNPGEVVDTSSWNLLFEFYSFCQVLSLINDYFIYYRKKSVCSARCRAD